MAEQSTPSNRSGESSPKAHSKEDEEDPALELATFPVEPAATIHEGEQKSKQLSWKELSVCLIVEAVALGTLNMPSAFAQLGMVAGVILTVGLGLIAIYTSYVVGQVKLKNPQVQHYADAVHLIWGRVGFEITGSMFTCFLTLLAGSHNLTGTIAFVRIAEPTEICALYWGLISGLLLFAFALVPNFHNFAFLGYIDFCSIIAAVSITIIATGIQAHSAPGGLGAVDWSLWPPEDIDFYKVFLATSNIAFAYSFTVCQFSFMADMSEPKEYKKSIYYLCGAEILIYTLTGALIYAFVGADVQSPALLSAGGIVPKIAFGVAIPVIIISGAINSTVVGRYIMDRAFENSRIRYVNTAKGWCVWIALIGTITVVGWVIAEAIPFFPDLLGIISALFISGFSFYFPASFWFGLIREGKWYKGWKNILLSILNAIIFTMGVVILVVGTYASAMDIISKYQSNLVGRPFSCDSKSYVKLG